MNFKILTRDLARPTPLAWWIHAEMVADGDEEAQGFTTKLKKYVKVSMEKMNKDIMKRFEKNEMYAE